MRYPTPKTQNYNLETRILQKVSRSFALTIPQLPTKLAPAVANAYLLCRIVDTIEDEAGLSLDQKQQFFREFVEVVNNKFPAEQFANGLHPLLSARTLPAEHELILNTPAVMRTFFGFSDRQQTVIRQCVETMSYGMLEFQKIQNPYGLETLSQMNDYCYYVAGVVGDMVTGLFCDYSGEIAQKREKLMHLAASFGQGLQMTNIIKDLWEDKARGACWFPRDVFQKAGFDLNGLTTAKYRPGFGEGLSTLIGLAHAHLENALDYTLLLPKHETGIRKFCMWAVGMAVFTLQNIYKTRDYTCGQDVKISRDTTRRIIMVTNAAIKSNFLLKIFFHMAARGLPLPETKVCASQPDPVRILENQPGESQRNIN